MGKENEPLFEKVKPLFKDNESGFARKYNSMLKNPKLLHTKDAELDFLTKKQTKYMKLKKRLDKKSNPEKYKATRTREAEKEKAAKAARKTRRAAKVAGRRLAAAEEAVQTTELNL